MRGIQILSNLIPTLKPDCCKEISRVVRTLISLLSYTVYPTTSYEIDLIQIKVKIKQVQMFWPASVLKKWIKQFNPSAC